MDLVGLTDLYLQCADAEHPYDELKNPWGWGGFMTQDLHRCQAASRHVARVYNWWRLLGRCAPPPRPRQAITRRPLWWCGSGRWSESGHQLKVPLTRLHEGARAVRKLLTGLSQFFGTGF